MLPIWIDPFELNRIRAAYPDERGLFSNDLAELVKTCRRLVKPIDTRSKYVLRHTDDMASWHGAIPALLRILGEQVRK